jgi:hypothetical protein
LERGDPARLEDLVYALFQGRGYVVERSQLPNDVADLAVWLDSVEASLGNPLLVEVKTGNLTEAQLTRSESQMRSRIGKTAAQLGLLVYLDRRGRKFPTDTSSWPLVVRISAVELVSLLGNGTLEETLVQWRNSAVHGKA